jgi:hypothetical protein
MTRLILTDIDETVLMCADRLQLFVEQAMGRPALRRLRDHYRVDEAFGITPEQSMEMIHDFWRDGAFGHLAPETCAAAVLPSLHALGWHFVAISACPGEPGLVAARARNLRDAFGFEWDGVHCVGEDKSACLKRYAPAVWVEDNWHNGVIGAEIGHRAYMLDRPHNGGREHPLVRRVADWHEIRRDLGSP